MAVLRRMATFITIIIIQDWKINGKIFYNKTFLNDKFRVYYQQKSLKEKGKVFLDPNKLSSDGTTSINQQSWSDDGSLFAYGISEKGSDWVTLKVFYLIYNFL